MRSKTFLAALLIGGLALAGCSNSDDNASSSNNVTRSAALARIEGGTASIAGYGSMPVSNGEFVVDLNRVAGLAKPYTVEVDGGKLMSGSNKDAWKKAPKLSAVVFDPASAKEGNVNLASELVAQIFAKLPGGERNAEGYKSVTQAVADTVLVYAKTLNSNASVDNIFGTWSSDNEAVLLAAMVAMGVAKGIDASSVAKIQDIEANALTILTGFVTSSFRDGATVGTLQYFADAAKGYTSTPEFSAGIQAAQKPYADAVAENTKDAPAPKPVPSEPVLFGGWIFNGSENLVVGWNVNNSSVNESQAFQLNFFGAYNGTTKPTNSSETFLFKPATVVLNPVPSGLTVTGGTNGVLNLTVNGSALIKSKNIGLGNSSTVIFPMTFTSVKDKHQSGTVNAHITFTHDGNESNSPVYRP